MLMSVLEDLRNNMATFVDIRVPDLFHSGDYPLPLANVSEFDESSQDSGYSEEEDSYIGSPASYHFKAVRNLHFESPDLMCLNDVKMVSTESRESPTNSKTPGHTSRRLKRRRRCNVDDTSPVDKRRKGYVLEKDLHGNKNNPELGHARETRIKSILDRVSEDPTLIADGSESYCLPTVQGKHQDIKSITPQTLARVIKNEFDNIIGNYVVVDCRYPYEFEGGHIEGAKNYYTKDAIMENLVKSRVQSEDMTKRTVVIFHCEFSSERGPKLCRFLRATDRDINKDRYPSLFYPEVYILNGGYKEFFQEHKELCCPQAYVPMLMDDYKKDLRKFRIKSKSWQGESRRTFPCRFLAF